MAFTMLHYIAFVILLLKQSYLAASQMTALNLAGDVRSGTSALTANPNYSNQSTKDFITLQTNLCNSIQTATAATTNYFSIYQRCDVVSVNGSNVATRVLVLNQVGATMVDYTNASVLTALGAEMQAATPAAAPNVVAYSAAPSITVSSVTTPSMYPSFVLSGNVAINGTALANNVNYATNTSKDFITLQANLCSSIRTAIASSARYYGMFAGCYLLNVTAPRAVTRIVINENNAGAPVNLADAMLVQNFTAEIAAAMPASGAVYSAPPTITVERTASTTGTAAVTGMNLFLSVGAMLLALNSLVNVF